ncbi:YbhB/YbcL family Raf kinase inhibitor-like protein [Microbacterium aoyamense]|uniref:YbhB/YbcL family Raf kinase inhibitor-like protein n=1 Tax=Microbacterium aoyamense TaxID=344166 RepID=A0ABN2PCR3_9MICO|nr:YbhB/YbcL family Raf kinase inhibitor-like protein [Microbacterium aoyamense]
MPESAGLVIRSPHLQPLELFPVRFTGDGANAAPSLVVSGVPAGATELAIVMDDPDAPLPHGFTHWLLYGVPALDRAVDLDDPSVRVGPNTMGERAYIGPMPPRGHGRHHYFFQVYALSETVDGEPSREEFLARYAASVIEQSRFVAYYERFRHEDPAMTTDA